MKNKTIKLYKTDNKLGFDYNGTFITDPFVTECQRFAVDPIKDYGLNNNQVIEICKTNNLSEINYYWK